LAAGGAPAPPAPPGYAYAPDENPPLYPRPKRCLGVGELVSVIFALSEFYKHDPPTVADMETQKIQDGGRQNRKLDLLMFNSQQTQNISGYTQLLIFSGLPE
jgi:hypothetical protein